MKYKQTEKEAYNNELNAQWEGLKEGKKIDWDKLTKLYIIANGTTCPLVNYDVEESMARWKQDEKDWREHQTFRSNK